MTPAFTSVLFPFPHSHLPRPRLPPHPHPDIHPSRHSWAARLCCVQACEAVGSGGSRLQAGRGRAKWTEYHPWRTQGASQSGRLRRKIDVVSVYERSMRYLAYLYPFIDINSHEASAKRHYPRPHPPHAHLPQQNWKIQAHLRRHCTRIGEKL